MVQSHFKNTIGNRFFEAPFDKTKRSTQNVRIVIIDDFV